MDNANRITVLKYLLENFRLNVIYRPMMLRHAPSKLFTSFIPTISLSIMRSGPDVLAIIEKNSLIVKDKRSV